MRARLKLQTQQQEPTTFMLHMFVERITGAVFSSMVLATMATGVWSRVCKGCINSAPCSAPRALTARKDPELAPGLGGQGQGHYNHLTC